MDGDIVEAGTVEVEYIIRAFEVDGVVMYDWVAARDSDELYETVEKAREAAKRSLSY